MIKIKDIEVKNFKSLYETKVDHFGDVNMFYGFNNSGKSNIFKFLKMLFEKKKKGTKVKVKTSEEGAKTRIQNETLIETGNFWNGYIWNEPFLFSKNNRQNPITFKVNLIIRSNILPDVNELIKEGFADKDETIITLIGQITSNDMETSELKITDAFANNKPFFKLDDNLEVFFENTNNELITNKSGEAILQLFDDLVLFIDSDRNFSQEISKNGVTKIDIKNFKNALYELNINAEKNEKFNELLDFLSTFDFSKEAKTALGRNINSFPFNEYTDIGFARFDDDEMEVMLDNANGRFPLKNYGTGIQQFLYLLTKIFNNKGRVIIIEELELNLSPLYQKELLRFLKLLMPKYFDQLIFSSHSPFFTQKDSTMVDIIHHVQIDFIGAGGTSVDCHDDIPSTYDEVTGHSYFSLLYS